MKHIREMILHSNMVRFKSAHYVVEAGRVAFYIPIWFDLNSFTYLINYTFIIFYIPIWFDLNMIVTYSVPSVEAFTFQYGSI